MDLWTTLSVLAYVLLVALLESLLASAILLLIVWLFPKSALEGKRAVLVALFSILAFVWLIPSHYPAEMNRALKQYLPFLSSQAVVIIWAVLFFVVFAGIAFFLRKNPAWLQRMSAILDRFTVLAGFYLFLDIIAILIVILANLR